MSEVENDNPSWIHQHDQRWSFILPYTCLAIILSAWVSLFWLVLLILIHFGIEWMRFGNLSRIIPQMHLDVALLIAAVAVEVYLGVLLGAAGVAQAARGGAKVVTRFPVWHRVLKMVLIGADDLLNLARISNKSGGSSEIIPKSIAAISLFLLIASPIILGRPVTEILSIAIAAFHPLPGW